MKERKEMERLPWELEAGTGKPGSTEVLAFARYPDLEAAADRTAVKIKEGFLEMGYILKVARDTDILTGSGYTNHEEFAEKRYGLDKGTVSRYIRIVERFSVGGNSHVLQEGYKNIGFAKLSLMLHMPDAIAEEITAGYSKQEVQAVKEEIEAERAVSDIELAIEAAETQEEKPADLQPPSLLTRALRQLCREHPEIYRRFHAERFRKGGVLPEASRIMEILAPQGEAIHMARIPGMGRLMISLAGDNINVTNVRTWDKEKCNPYDVLDTVCEMCHRGTVEDSYFQEYGEPLEAEASGRDLSSRRCGDSNREKRRPEAAGNGKDAPSKEKRKESKVTKAAPRKKPEAAGVRKTQDPPKPVVPEKPEEEQLPGQMEVMDYPEAIPDVHYEELSAEMEDTSREESAGKKEESMEFPAGSSENAEKTECGALQGEVSSGETGKDSGEEDVMDLQMEAEKHLDCLKQYFTIWDRGPMPEEMLEKAYREAIDLAAALERMMDGRKGAENGEEYHAQ